MNLGKTLVWFIYVQPLHRIIIIAVLAIIIWAKMMSRLETQDNNTKICIVINALFLVIWFLGVLCATLLEREKQTINPVLRPLYSLSAAMFSTEIIRLFFMNAFLFLPLGMCFPFILPCHQKHKIRDTVLAAILVSGVIEVSQFYFHLGCCEVDDVIMNTLGALIGTLAYDLSVKNNKEKRWKSKERSRLK